MHSSKYLKIPDTSGTFSKKATIIDSVILKPLRHDSTSEITWRLVFYSFTLSSWALGKSLLKFLDMEQFKPHCKYSETEQEKTAPSGLLYCSALRENNVAVGLAHTNSSSTSFITHKHLSFEACSCWPDPGCGVHPLFLLCLEERGVREGRARGKRTPVFSSEPNV